MGRGGGKREEGKGEREEGRRKRDENLGLGGGRWVRMVLVGCQMGWCGEGRMRSGLDWVKEEIR